MKALRYTDGTIVFVERLTYPSVEDSNGFSWCMVETVEVDGETDRFPVGAVRKVPAQALINV